ncbi:MAG: hypothetical protein ACI9H8_001524 [Lysobacterales bacterium]|jgi:hypothetical protein
MEKIAKDISITDEHQDYFAYFDANKRIFHRRVCVIPEGMAVPAHACLGANRVRDFDGFLHIGEIVEYIDQNTLEPKTVAYDDIWQQIHFHGEKEQALKTNRFNEADVSYPGIISNIKNPDNKPYRMLDGRRRLWKRQQSGAKEGLFYVIPETVVFGFFWLVIPLTSARGLMNGIQARSNQPGLNRN